MLNGLIIAVYARFSSANQKDTSIDDQVRLCRDFIDRSGGHVDNANVLTDYSVSAASIARAGFERLLLLIERRAIGVVVTESADRLTRDLGDADRLWKLCAYYNVRLICVADGIDSARDGARMAFRFKAMMSDEYLVDLSNKTARGLEGTALRGHCTGGLPFGYCSRALFEKSQRDPSGYEILVDEEKAPLVRRIFELYASGQSYLSIARLLNGEKIPPPRASTRRASRGWCDTTIREMLSNAAYVGQWSFGKKKWRKVPGTNTRRYQKQPAERVKSFERPHLRIVDDELWRRVQERRQGIAAKYASKDRATPRAATGLPGRRTSYPFSGLLRCGACGAIMQVIGGSTCRYYRCADAHKRGTCSNRAPIREPVITGLLLAELRAALLSLGGVNYARTRLAEKQAELAEERGAARRAAEKSLTAREAEIARLVRFIATTDDDTALAPVRSALADAQRELERTRAAAQMTAEPPVHIELPSDDEIRATVFELDRLLTANATAARELLRQAFKDGRIDLHPEADGAYRIEAVMLPLALARPLIRRVETKKPRSAEPNEAFVYNHGCAGANRSISTSEDLGFPYRFVVPLPLDRRRLPETWRRRSVN